MQQATRPNVYRNRKKYTRKDKHRNAEDKQSGGGMVDAVGGR